MTKKINLDKLAEEVALRICMNEGVKPDDSDGWWGLYKALYYPRDAFKALEEMGYEIIKRKAK